MAHGSEADYLPDVRRRLQGVRGDGVALWLFVQDLSQLKKVYPKADSLLANAAKQFWSTVDLETAQYISGMLGRRPSALSPSQETSRVRWASCSARELGRTRGARAASRPDWAC